MNFVKGVADEDVVFSAFYQTYCKFIEKNFAIFCILRHKDKYNFYENTIDLYKIWSSRAKAQGLSIQQKSIMLQLESINGGKKITPIGTK